MATTSAAPQTALRGGEFLLRTVAPDEVFTPEDFTEEHRAIARTTDEFFESWKCVQGSKNYSIRNRVWRWSCCASRLRWVSPVW